MNKIENFFLYCSGASFDLLKRCPTEKSKYVGIGATIFFTGLLASLSAGYALFTVFDNVWSAILLGCIWGMVIFNLDKYIVLSMRKNGKWYKEYLQAIPRIFLAILIAITISKPLELKLFEKEINSELTLIKEEILREQQNRVAARFSSETDSLNARMNSLKNEIHIASVRRDDLFEEARKEADGTGGSGKVNPGPIYQIKKQDAARSQLELESLRLANQVEIDKIKKQLLSLESYRKSAISQMGEPNVSGFMHRLNALTRLGEKYNSVWLADWFIILLFTTLELAPILAKLISNRGPYDDLLQVHEHFVRNYRVEKIEISDSALEKKLATL